MIGRQSHPGQMQSKKSPDVSDKIKRSIAVEVCGADRAGLEGFLCSLRLIFEAQEIYKFA